MRAHLVAWEANDDQSFISVLLVKRLKLFVLWSEACMSGSVHIQVRKVQAALEYGTRTNNRHTALGSDIDKEQRLVFEIPQGDRRLGELDLDQSVNGLSRLNDWVDKRRKTYAVGV